MTLNEVILLIQTWIVENGNEEITADVLRPILEAMVNQPNDLIGDLDNLTTTDKDNLVEAINEVRSLAITNAGLVIHSGSGTPTVTPPVSVGLGDFYAQVIFPSTSVVSFWQYNGSVWVEQRPQRTRTLLKFVSLIGVDVTGKSQVQWMAEAINLNISNGAVYECEAGDIIDFYVNLLEDPNNETPLLKRVFTRLNTGATSVTSVTEYDLMPDGSDEVVVDEDLIIELGNIGSDDIWDAFNASPDQPFEMDNEMFVSAIQDGDNKLWQWIGGTGTFGSTATLAVEGDFLDLTEQPEVMGNQNNIIKTIPVLDTDLATLDANGLETYFNELEPGIMKQGYESWLIQIINSGGDVLKTFDFVNRGKGPVGVEGIAENPANAVTADMFVERVGGASGVQTLTGDGVNNTDPDNPVLSFPTPAEIGTYDSGEIDALIAIKQSIPSGNFTLAPAQNDHTIANAGYDCTIDPNTQTYADKTVVAMKNIADSTDCDIVCTAATGWTYKVNDNAAVASGTFTFPAGATCTIIKFEGTNKIYIDGGVE